VKKFGLIGYPLGHSFSKKYFSEKFERESLRNCAYEIYPLEKIDMLPQLLDTEPELCGLNVTIPYKSEVMKFLDEVSEEAAAVGAVNVIKISRNNGSRQLKGFNSDIYGFRDSILQYLRGADSGNALILGTGGSSKAVAYVLRNLGITFIKVSREKQKGCITYRDLSRTVIETHEIIINTTPAGMYPDVSTCPDIPYEYLDSRHLLYDLVYNPEMTTFLSKGQQMGCRIAGGLKMLHFQAERAWRIWNDPTF
jgi:shikimate dehydrogenase